MKKIFTLVFVCVTAMAAMAQSEDTGSNAWGLSGSGTEADPYKVSTADDFAKMATNCTSEHKGTGEYFKMTNDIDFGGSADTPVQLPAIGKDGSAQITKIAFGFDGTFDGDNHTITGIYHTNNANNAKGKYNALFGCVDKNGVVKNVVMGKDNHIESYSYTGSIVSLNMGKIENCTNNADITGVQSFAGGICAYMLNGCGTIEKCKNYGNVISMTYASGICAGSQSGKTITTYTCLVEECVNYGNMSTTNGIGSAGIAGAYSGAVKNCTNNGNIDDSNGTAKSRQYTAGIISCPSYAAEVDGCINNGTVKGVKSVAGIVGNVMKGDEAAAVVKNCTNNGAVSSTATTENIGNLRGSANIALGNGNVIAEGLTHYTLDPASTGISDAIVDKQAVKNGKCIKNGRIVIINGDREYSVDGVKL